MFPTATTIVICSACQGEGTATYEKGSRFDSHAQQWYPTEAVRECETCDGTGEILFTYCQICGELERDCCCTEDDLDAWNTFEVAA